MVFASFVHLFASGVSVLCPPAREKWRAPTAPFPKWGGGAPCRPSRTAVRAAGWALAEGLRRNTSLTHLGLRYNVLLDAESEAHQWLVALPPPAAPLTTPLPPPHVQ